MAPDKQKGRPELAPSEAAHQITLTQQIFTQKTPELKGSSLKRLRTVQALLAMRGFELVRAARADDGRVSFVVSRAGKSWHLTHWHDVEAFLSSLGVRP
jgi:hypothetical protein